MVYRTGIWPSFLFPSPSGVLENLSAGIQDLSIPIAAQISIQRLFIGYSISLVIGLLLGIMIDRIKYLDQALSPLLLGVQTLPSICWLPLAILWFGLGEEAIIFVIAIGSIFSISMAVVSGIKQIPPLYIRAAKTMGAKGLRRYTSVVIPAALPAIISGMKQGWSFAWRALMAGELLTPTSGLGYVLIMGRDLHDMNQVVGIMIVIVIMGVVTDRLLFGRVEHAILYRWGLTRSH
ncbi:MAG: ABC transporter permease [Dethiobacter sp.]|nr:ABC transporter permease [Dethiobacter sp.]